MLQLGDIFFQLPFEINGYRIESILGRGGSAIIARAIRISTGHVFAAKIILCDSIDQKIVDMQNNERNTLINLLHPNIIKIYDEFRKDDYLFLILEICDKGNAEKFFKGDIRHTEQQLLAMMKQILSAVSYCHEQGIAHRDIKPSNILINENDIPKLCDFGLGLKIKEGEMIKNSSGTFYFKAPELLKKEEHCPLKSDIWSLGVTFYFLATGKYPWGTTTKAIEKNILSCNYSFPANTPMSIIQIIKQMIVSDPAKRASAKHLLMSSTFASINLGAHRVIHNIHLKRIPLGFNSKKTTKSLKLTPITSVILKPRIKITRGNSYNSNPSENTPFNLLI